MWESYLLPKNIERYRALLRNPSTSAATKSVLLVLLADAEAELSALSEVRNPIAHC